jgi:hypothetical protein
MISHDPNATAANRTTPARNFLVNRRPCRLCSLTIQALDFALQLAAPVALTRIARFCPLDRLPSCFRQIDRQVEPGSLAHLAAESSGHGFAGAVGVTPRWVRCMLRRSLRGCSWWPSSRIVQFPLVIQISVFYAWRNIKKTRRTPFGRLPTISDRFVLFFEIPKAVLFPPRSNRDFSTGLSRQGRGAYQVQKSPKKFADFPAARRGGASIDFAHALAPEAICLSSHVFSVREGVTIRRPRHPGLSQSRSRLIPRLLAKLIPAWLCLGVVTVAQFAALFRSRSFMWYVES